jgi:FkbM family methyltransferase
MEPRINIKRRLVGTGPGRLLAKARDFAELIQTPRVALGTVVNDQLASSLVTRLLGPGRAFVDVGAHIGWVSAEVIRHCEPSQIIMFEAIPSKAEWLRKKFPSAEVNCVALSDAAGTVSFFVDEENSGYSSLSGERLGMSEIKVRSARLDDMVDRSDVDLIKIDVEGAELGVLRGGEKIINRCRPLLMFESGPQDHLGYTKEAMFAWLSSHDYQIFAPNRLAHTGGAMDLHAYLDSHEYPRRTTNYFAMHSSREKEWRDRAKKVLFA